jgi:hypothetical protein
MRSVVWATVFHRLIARSQPELVAGLAAEFLKNLIEPDNEVHLTLERKNPV